MPTGNFKVLNGRALSFAAPRPPESPYPWVILHQAKVQEALHDCEPPWGAVVNHRSQREKEKIVMVALYQSIILSKRRDVLSLIPARGQGQPERLPRFMFIVHQD